MVRKTLVLIIFSFFSMVSFAADSTVVKPITTADDKDNPNFSNYTRTHQRYPLFLFITLAF